MKHFLLTFLVAFIPLAFLSAQSDHPVAGSWEGAIKLPGQVLKMSLTVSGNEPLLLTVDVPQQNINAMPATDVVYRQGKTDSLRFQLPGVPGNAGWAGYFAPAPNADVLDSLIGNWQQGGQSTPLNFARPSGPLAGPELADNLAKIEAYAVELIGRMNVPGAGIAIVRGDEVLTAFGVGYADLEAKRPATGNTVFAIGSSSKAFTSFGLALLADEGKLEWDKPVVEYLPDFRMYDDFATREMTAIDLLTHRSGLPRHDLLWYLNDDLSREELFGRLRYLEPTKSFRSAWQYQNLMYMTAGILTERISGESWEDYTRANIFDPLGMTSANFDVASFPDLPDFAYGYSENEEESLEKMDFHPISAVGPAGSINANALDMGKWVSLHLNGGKFGNEQIISESALSDLHTSRMFIGSNGIFGGVSHTGYALGWFTYDWNGTSILEHGGNIDGYSALVYMAPEEDIGFVILTNKNGTEYGSYLARYALDVLTGAEDVDYYEGDYDDEKEDEEDDDAEEDQESPFAKTKPQHGNPAYVGVYLDPGYGAVTITDKDGQLSMSYGSLAADLNHYHFETFKAPLEELGQDIDVHFIAGVNGKIRSLEIVTDPALGHPIIFEKQADASMTAPEYLDKLAGEYLLDQQTLTIKRVRDHLTLDVPGQPTYELAADSDNEFKLVIVSGYSVEFHFEKDKVVALELHQPNGDFRAERKE